MNGIEMATFVRMPSTELAAMRASYAATFGVPLDRVGWREQKRRGVVRMFLYLKPKSKARSTWKPGDSILTDDGVMEPA